MTMAAPPSSHLLNGTNRQQLEFLAQDLAALRQKKIRQYQLRFSLANIGVTFFLLLMFYAKEWGLAWININLIPSTYIVIILIIGILIAFFDSPRRQFRRQYNEKVFNGFLKTIADLKYSLRGEWSEKKLYKRRLVPPYQRLFSEDHFTGTYEGVGVHLSEVQLTDVHTQDNKQQEYTLFKGMFVELTLPRPMSGKIVIVKDYGFLMNKLTGLRQWGLQSITLEDPHFESLFQVYGTDQMAARRLLTPVFMERLVSLLDHLGTSSLALSIEDNEMFMTIPYEKWGYWKNRFEAPSFYRPITVDTLQNTLREVLSVLQLIDILKLSA